MNNNTNFFFTGILTFFLMLIDFFNSLFGFCLVISHTKLAILVFPLFIVSFFLHFNIFLFYSNTKKLHLYSFIFFLIINIGIILFCFGKAFDFITRF